MDDLNRQLQQALRAQALQDQARLEQERAEQVVAPAERPAPVGAGRLVMAKRQGEWRYYLNERRVRVGEAVEFYVDPKIGWIRGTFQWGRRNTAPPTIRVHLQHPEDPALFVGEMVVSLPDDAICRFASDEEAPDTDGAG